MLNAYDGEKIKKDIEKSIDHYESAIKALKKVERVHKKDGGNFSNFNRNFKNCEISSDYNHNKEMMVYFPTKNHGYDYHSFSLSRLVKYMKKEDMKHEPLPKERCLEQVYVFDVDETEKELKREIELCERRLEKYKLKAEKMNSIFEKIDEAILNLVEEIPELKEYEYLKYLEGAIRYVK